MIHTRVYVTDIERWGEVGAHSEVFRKKRPVTVLVEVSHLIDPEIMVEIEAVAYLPESQ